MKETERLKYQKGKIDYLEKDNDINKYLIHKKEMAEKFLRDNDKELKEEIQEKVRAAIEEVITQLKF